MLSRLDMAFSRLRRAPDWTSLPRHIAILILERLVPEVSDYIHFAATCRNWLSAACEHQSMARKRPFFPELLIPPKDQSEIHRGFYNAIEDRIVDTRLHTPNKRCCGSSHGWLIFTEETLDLVLFNPFTGAAFHLPPVDSPLTDEEIDERDFYDHEYQVQKVVLSADPSVSPDSYEALAIFEHGDLAFFRCGSTTWTHAMWNSEWGTYEEVAYSNGKFYAASLELLVRIDVVCDNPQDNSMISINLRKVASRTVDDWVHKTYLVGTPCRRLLWIDRFYAFKGVKIVRDDSNNVVDYFEIDDDRQEDVDVESWIHHFTSSFKVYEVKEEMEGEAQLTGLKTLGDKVVFVGHNNSELVPTRDFPEYRGNCIYYMDDCLHLDEDGTPYPFGAVDIGVFNLEDQCCKPLDPVRGGCAKGHMPPPIWILPKANLMSKPASF